MVLPNLIAGVAHTLARGEARRLGPTRPIDFDWSADSALPVSLVVSPQEWDDRELMLWCISQLSAEERELLELYQERTQKQVASVLGVSTKTVGRKLRKIGGRLRELYFDDEG